MGFFDSSTNDPAFTTMMGTKLGAGRKRVDLGSSLKPPSEREQWRMDRMAKLMQGTGMELPEDVLRAISTDQEMSDRFVKNAGEFYSHPGSYQALQQALGMYGQQGPDVYGAPWESAIRSRMMAGIGGEISGMQDQAASGMAQRGMYGALGGTQQTQIGQAGALARLQAMLGLRTTLDDKRYQMFQDQFARDFQASSLLSGLVGGQPAYPVIQDQGETKSQQWAAILGGGGSMLGGAASMLALL